MVFLKEKKKTLEGLVIFNCDAICYAQPKKVKNGEAYFKGLTYVNPKGNGKRFPILKNWRN